MNVLWIPIFSMRSYETGKYAILKDGNFQLTLARALASDFNHITITVPEDSSDFVEAVALLKRGSKKERGGQFITLKPMKYGKNAVETREQFWKLNANDIDSAEAHQEYDLLITDITGYRWHEFGFKVIYNFNITKLPELDRPYIDKFFEQDLKSIEESLFTTVINPRQREYILEVRPDLLDKVIVNTKCAHRELMPNYRIPLRMDKAKVIFWPFRISDKAYQFEQFLKAFEEQGLDKDGYIVLCTDPNDTLQTDASFVLKRKLTKEEYYKMLGTRPIIVMLDDMDTVLHPGTIEFFHYRCPTITYHSDIYSNPNAITDLSMLAKTVKTLVYNAFDEEIERFVYDEEVDEEIDEYYNQEFVNVRQN